MLQQQCWDTTFINQISPLPKPWGWPSTIYIFLSEIDIHWHLSFYKHIHQPSMVKVTSMKSRLELNQCQEPVEGLGGGLEGVMGGVIVIGGKGILERELEHQISFFYCA